MIARIRWGHPEGHVELKTVCVVLSSMGDLSALFTLLHCLIPLSISMTRTSHIPISMSTSLLGRFPPVSVCFKPITVMVHEMEDIRWAGFCSALF